MFFPCKKVSVRRWQDCLSIRQRKIIRHARATKFHALPEFRVDALSLIIMLHKTLFPFISENNKKEMQHTNTLNMLLSTF